MASARAAPLTAEHRPPDSAEEWEHEHDHRPDHLRLPRVRRAPPDGVQREHGGDEPGDADPGEGVEIIHSGRVGRGGAAPARKLTGPDAGFKREGRARRDEGPRLSSFLTRTSAAPGTRSPRG